jgi:transcriptional regulator with XRE-family HTH domain
MEPVSPGENARRGIQTKLSQADVDSIRELRHTMTARDVAAKFGITPGYVGNIWRGIRWGEYGARKKAEEASKSRRINRDRTAILPDEEVARVANGGPDAG